jgi:hypothetical protein
MAPTQRISFCALFPGHVILAYRSELDFLVLENLQLYSISSLDGLWGPIATIAANIRPNLHDIPSVTCRVPRHNKNIKVDSIEISVTASPLHATTYDCVLEVVNRTPILHPTSLLKRLRNKFIRKPPPADVPDIPKTVYRYSIFRPSVTTSAADLPQFQLKSILHCPEMYPQFMTVARAGYWLSYQPGRTSTEVHRLADAGETAPPIIIPELDHPFYLNLTPSGALLAMYRPSCLVLSYYQ